jgi:trehalose 6-phosphate synthase
VGLCSPEGRVLQSTDRFPEDLSCEAAVQLSAQAEPRLSLRGGAVHVGVQPIMGQPPPPPAQELVLIDEPAAARRAAREAAAMAAEVAARRADPALTADGAIDTQPRVLKARLVLLHDLSFIDRRSQDSRNYLIGLIVALGLVIAIITVVVAQLSWRGWVKGVRAVVRGEGLLSPLLMGPPELEPFAAELRARLRDLEDECRRSQGPDTEWNAERLRTLLRSCCDVTQKSCARASLSSARKRSMSVTVCAVKPTKSCSAIQASIAASSRVASITSPGVTTCAGTRTPTW